MNTKKKSAKVSTTICPRITDVYALYPWCDVILTDYRGNWYAFEDAKDALSSMNWNRSLRFVY